MLSGQQIKKHFLKCHDNQGCARADRFSGQQVVQATWDKKDKGDKCGEKEKGDKPCRLESKSGNNATSQDQVLESLCRSLCIAESSAVGSHHKSHKKLKKHGKKSHESHRKSHQ